MISKLHGFHKATASIVGFDRQGQCILIDTKPSQEYLAPSEYECSTAIADAEIANNTDRTALLAVPEVIKWNSIEFRGN